MLSRLYSFDISRKKAGAARRKKRAVSGARMILPETVLQLPGLTCRGVLKGWATITRCSPSEVRAALVFLARKIRSKKIFNEPPRPASHHVIGSLRRIHGCFSPFGPRVP